jgi:hypothetical protein
MTAPFFYLCYLFSALLVELAADCPPHLRRADWYLPLRATGHYLKAANARAGAVVTVSAASNRTYLVDLASNLYGINCNIKDVRSPGWRFATLKLSGTAARDKHR